jgi:hypothetical protein
MASRDAPENGQSGNRALAASMLTASTVPLALRARNVRTAGSSSGSSV